MRSRHTLALTFCLTGACAIGPVQAITEASPAVAGTVVLSPSVVAGSTRVVCSLTGHGKSHASVHLAAADRGYSFAYNGATWWLFGDTRPTDPTVRPKFVDGLDNDSMATSPVTKPGKCPVLSFPTTGAPVAGAYVNPSVLPDPWPGTPAVPQVSLKTNETAVAGLEVKGTTYVVFDTDNPSDAVPPGPSNCPSDDTNCFGNDTRSVMAVLENAKTLQFKGLYDLSAPTTTGTDLNRYGGGAKFVGVAMEPAQDGYVYIWGTQGAAMRRMGDPYLARLLPADIATGHGISYFEGYGSSGAPSFGSKESDATTLFSDSPGCTGEIGVSWNAYLGAWTMLYDCKDSSAGRPAGIWLRTSPEPWGPWSSPQTVFDPEPWTTPAKAGEPDQKTTMGFCYFIHEKPVSLCPKGASNQPKNANGKGSYYGPYFVNGATTGTFATTTAPATSQISYTLDTFQPYGQLILSTALRGSTFSRPVVPPCKGTACT
jgi:Domain of unknown function (DUF4185)